jgi:hypothetical protein
MSLGSQLVKYEILDNLMTFALRHFERVPECLIQKLGINLIPKIFNQFEF